MSSTEIRDAIRAAVKAIDPPLDTVWENGAVYTPKTGRPYQKVDVLFGETNSYSLGSGYIETGILQIMLLYPLKVGTAPITERIDLIRAAFPKNRRFTSGSTTVKVIRPARIVPGYTDGDRWAVPVSIRFTDR